jgi:hypothetical protein
MRKIPPNPKPKLIAQSTGVPLLTGWFAATWWGAVVATLNWTALVYVTLDGEVVQVLSAGNPVQGAALKVTGSAPDCIPTIKFTPAPWPGTTFSVV